MLHCLKTVFYYPLERFVATKFKMPSVERSCVVHEVAADGIVENVAFDHSSWDAVLKAHVRRGTLDGIVLNVVDYHALANDDRVAAYRNSLSAADLGTLSPNEKLALYINAYNCLCAGLIVARLASTGALPVSINDLSSDGTPVWKQPAGVVGGERLSLDDIEHRILRSRWREPRVHSSIVCASVSCPDLRPEAFVASRINEQMDDQCATWLRNEHKGVGRSGRTLTLSRILLWFQQDFVAVAPSVGAWAARYLDTDHPARPLAQRNASPAFFEYNWKLNAAADA